MKTALIEACIAWANETNDRSVKIHHDTRYPRGEFAVWCYSYKVGEGKYVQELSDIPTDSELAETASAEAKRRIERLRDDRN